MLRRCCYDAMKRSCSTGNIIARCQNLRLVLPKQSVRFLRNKAGAGRKQLNPRSRLSSSDDKAGKEQSDILQPTESDIDDVVRVRFLHLFANRFIFFEDPKRREPKSSGTTNFGYLR
jgi:hypothetical protein